MNNQPNIILMTCHDLGQHLNCYGIDTVHSPNLDRFAREGVKFENSFCTAPQCSPSRAAMITGRFPHSNGVVGLAHGQFKSKLKDDEKPLSVILKEDDGYDTYLFGVEHSTYDVEAFEFTEIFRCGPENVQMPDCRDIVTSFESFIKKRDNEKPFYAQIGFFEPHHPFDHGGVKPDFEKGVKVPPYLGDSNVAIKELALYQGAIRKVDTSIGDILGLIEEYCDRENTWIIFTTDHGSAFPRAKLTLYDAGIKTAFMMQFRAQDIGGGKVINDMVSNVDLLPTILEGIHAPIPGNVQGQSFWKLLKGECYPKRKEIYAEKTYHQTYDPMRAVRTEDYKLIVNFEAKDVKSSYIELYDLKKDPIERNNLSGLKEYENVLKTLVQQLYKWMKETSDPLLYGAIPSATYTERITNFKKLGEMEE